MKRILCSFILLSAILPAALPQACTTLGQTPATAFPVCGTSVFTQTNVPVCGITNVPVPCASTGIPYQDKNPFWYKFTCFSAGTIGFTITPNNLGDDYDWQLFDITGHNPNDVFTDKSLFVSCNWSGETGVTGSSSAGSSVTQCGGLGIPLFSKMANLVQGHEYLLLVSHFTGDQQSGYKLEFKGGSAIITDPKTPQLASATTSCDATEVRIALNKKMKCASLAADGSDFALSGGATIVSASSATCGSGFDMDAMVLTLSNPLPPGNYTVTAKTGADGNTLLDNCDNGIAVGDKLDFTIVAAQPTPMDSLRPVTCAPQQLQLVFRKPIRCSSIAGNGSDFAVTGPDLVTVTGAAGNCVNGLTTTIDLTLGGPLVVGGNYTITLKNGTDLNTLIDECGQQTPAGSAIIFGIRDTVSAGFSVQNRLGCRFDTLTFSHDGRNGVNQWQWSIDNTPGGTTSTQTNVFSASSQHTVGLIVSNGFCSDSSVVTVTLDNEVKADFTMAPIICPEDSLTAMDNSSGLIDGWLWNFSNGNTSNLPNPPAQHYPVTGSETFYTVQLSVYNTALNCQDQATKQLKVLGSCYIAVPSAFTPNGDGRNDFLYPLNAVKADQLDFRVFNRWGQMVFRTNDWLRKWDGMLNGVLQEAGVYVWTLRFVNRDTGKKVEMKGTTMLIR